MRLCIVNEFFFPDDTGGTGTVLSEMAAALRREHGNVQIDVVTSNKRYRDTDARLPAFEEWDGIRIFRLDTPHPSGLPPARRLAANAHFAGDALAHLRRQGRYDLLLVGTAPPTAAVVAHAYKALTGTPYLYVVYDLEPDRAVALGLLSAHSPLAALLRRSQRHWLHAASRVVVLGRCMQEHVARAYALPNDRITVIPTGADPDALRPLSRVTRFRDRHGLSGFVALYSGNFGRYHDFDTVLDAAKELRARRAGVTFVLVGGGSQKAHIVRRVAAEGLENVRVLPFVPQGEYADLLASADVSLVTLEPGMEGLCVPSKFYSILASGRPTLAMLSPFSEVARIIGETDCGLRIEPGDTAGLAGTLARLAQAPQELDRMGRNARQALVEHYGTPQIAARYYEAMCASVGRGVPAVLTYSRGNQAGSGSHLPVAHSAEAGPGVPEPRADRLAAYTRLFR